MWSLITLQWSRWSHFTMSYHTNVHEILTLSLCRCVSKWRLMGALRVHWRLLRFTIASESLCLPSQATSMKGECKFNFGCGSRCICSHCSCLLLFSHTLTLIQALYYVKTLCRVLHTLVGEYSKLVTEAISYDFHHSEIYFASLLFLSLGASFSLSLGASFRLTCLLGVSSLSRSSVPSVNGENDSFTNSPSLSLSSPLFRQNNHLSDWWMQKNFCLFHSCMSRGGERERDEIRKKYFSPRTNFRDDDLLSLSVACGLWEATVTWIRLHLPHSDVLLDYIFLSFPSPSPSACLSMSPYTFIYAIYISIMNCLLSLHWACTCYTRCPRMIICASNKLFFQIIWPSEWYEAPWIHLCHSFFREKLNRWLRK